MSEHAPDVCPDCGAAKEHFVYYGFDEDDWAAEEELDALRELAQLDSAAESEANGT